MIAEGSGTALDRWQRQTPLDRAMATARTRAKPGDIIALAPGVYRSRPGGYSQAHIRKVIKQLRAQP